MSAREELFESLTPMYGTQFAPGEEDSVNALLDAYRDEVLYEAAEKAREFGGPASYPGESEANVRFMAGWHAAVNYIDPDSDVNRCQGCGNPVNSGQVHGYGAEYGGCV